jgi:4-diphosphocytidyl-2-C-methyl-D-erythritol kinase
MVSFPPCKINLGLNVVSKRSDGYHDIETCFYPIPWTDALEIIPATETRFTTSGTIIPGKTDDNLCLKAYELLQHDFPLPPVQIHLHKVIPTGAGLGGGSSDAAHTLRLLNTQFKLSLNTEQLKHYALQLGSDCPFFIEDRAMLGAGRGELLKPTTVNLAGRFIVLVKPDVHVSTTEAYAGVTLSNNSGSLKNILEQTPIDQWKDTLKNDFEASVFKKYPRIQELKQTLYEHGAVYASMSGSGSAVFGIFDKPVALHEQFAAVTYWSSVL